VRLAILEAENRRAQTPADLARMRSGAASGDPLTVRIAVRALGRLERPSLVPGILAALDHDDPDVRAEAANAIAQAAGGVRRGGSGGPPPATLLEAFRDRLAKEEDANVRAALVESLARLPCADPESLAASQQALLELAAQHAEVADRLGLAKAFEAFVRLHKPVALTPPALDLLRSLVGVVSLADQESLTGVPSVRVQAGGDPPRDVRVRRLALEALATVGALDGPVLDYARRDSDAQVRRIAMRAAARAKATPLLTAGLEDSSPMVRLEALRGLSGLSGDEVCAWILAATGDSDPHVLLQAIDQLAGCGRWDQAVTRLADHAADTASLSSSRGWHRAAHALVALATASPDRAAQALSARGSARNPFVRVYAARAARALKDRPTLQRLAIDSNDNVVEAAVEGLTDVAGCEAAMAYRAALGRRGYQVIRVAAAALALCEATPELLADLTTARERLIAEGHANSTDARAAIDAALQKLGTALVPAAPKPSPPPNAKPPATVDATLDELRRLASPRARMTIRDVGTIELLLITVEAPLTVVRFARLAEAGYFNGLTIHRVAPNFVLQGGSPDANEYVGYPDHMRDEVGLWPHVRGALGISTRGRDTGDAQFFIDLVDNPRLDDEYTVFAQVLTGMEVADRVLEGDVIESVQILAK
jgi:cyclophilin family peptidyl-prolyl cis-trans isomerase/HEAT repeat protein